MKNPFSGLFRARDKPQDSVSAAPVFYFGTSGSGKSVTVQSANLLGNVATSLAFDVVFRDFRLFCFGLHEKCTQSVLTKWTILNLFVVLQISTLMSRTPTPRLP